MVAQEHVSAASRTLRNLIEPIAGAVYFVPEVQWRYRELGLRPSPAADGASPWEVHEAGAASYGAQYFCSRSACMGELAGPAVAAIFGLFEPGIVSASIEEGWALTRPADVLRARETGVSEALERLLHGVPEGVSRATELLQRGADGVIVGGHPIAASLLALDVPDHPLGALWRAADVIREHRGDSHNNAWASFGLDPVEVGLLSEYARGLPLRSHVSTRGWRTEQIDAAQERLDSRGWSRSGRITDEGMAARDAIEEATDVQERRIIGAIGPDLSELFSFLATWSAQVFRGGGYHIDPEVLLGGATPIVPGKAHN